MSNWFVSCVDEIVDEYNFILVCPIISQFKKTVYQTVTSIWEIFIQYH